MRADRPTFVMKDGARVYLVDHDAYYTRELRRWRSAVADAHPDRGGSHKKAIRVQAAYGKWRQRERRWYRALGIDPPDGPRELVPETLTRALGSPARTFREIVRSALTEALTQSRSLKVAARRLGLSPAWVRGHCKRYGVDWRACLAAYRIARQAEVQRVLQACGGSEQAAAVALGMSRHTLHRWLAGTAKQIAALLVLTVTLSAQTPVLIESPKSADLAWVTTTGQLWLMWDEVSNVHGYVLYLGPSPGVYTQRIVVGTPNSYVAVPGVGEWHIAVTAYIEGFASGPPPTMLAPSKPIVKGE